MGENNIIANSLGKEKLKMFKKQRYEEGGDKTTTGHEAAGFSTDPSLPLLPIHSLAHGSGLRVWSLTSPWHHRTEQRKMGFS